MNHNLTRIFITIILVTIALVGCNSTSHPTSATILPAQNFAAGSNSTQRPSCTLTSEPPPGLPTTVLPRTTPTAKPITTPVANTGQLVETKLYSAKLNRDMPLLVYLPPGYSDSQKRYPTLYMLSGFNGDHREWVYWGICDQAETLMRGGFIQPFIIVMPEGDKSYWFNHAQVDGSDGLPWGDYIWQDVVNYTDTHYRTIPSRASRAIGGLSAGGQSAVMLALTHPEIFSIAGGHSLSIRGADGSLAFFGTPEYFEQYDLIWLIDHTQNWRDLQLWIDVGAEDNHWGGPIRDFHAQLDEHGIAHEWNDKWQGKHDNNYWTAHISDYLGWYASKLAGR